MKAAFFYGILFATILFLWYCLEYLLGLHDTYIEYHAFVSYFFAVPVVVVMASAVRHRKRQLHGGEGVRFGTLFSFGFVVALVASFVVVPVMYVFIQWVNPGFLDALAQHAIGAEGMDPSLASRRFSIGGFLLQHAALILIVGAVAAFVISVIMAAKRLSQTVQTV